MKKINKITLLFSIILLFNSCTDSGNAILDIKCPCTVVSISKYENEYTVKFQNKNNRSFKFYTEHLYSIGDTIK